MFKESRFVYILFSLFYTIMASITSATITLTSRKSAMRCHFHPEIELNPKFNYSCSLLNFHTYNSIPNVHEKNNKFYYHFSGSMTEGDKQKHPNHIDFYVISIPVGTYEIDDITQFIVKILEKQSEGFRMYGNKNTLKTIIECDPSITFNFSRDDSIGPLLGFNKNILFSKDHYISENPVNITHVDTIRIECDLIGGSYHNGKGTHVIHEFTPNVKVGYKMNEQPKNLIYYPVIRRRLNTLNINIVDQNGQPIDNRGELLTCRIHIKKDSY